MPEMVSSLICWCTFLHYSMPSLNSIVTVVITLVMYGVPRSPLSRTNLGPGEKMFNHLPTTHHSSLLL